MNDITADKIKDLLESTIKSNSAAWVAQSKYFDDLVKRNVSSFATLTDARVASLKEISESQTFNQAFEANVSYEESVREELTKMYEDNKQAWQTLQDNLTGIYMPTTVKKKKAA